MSQPHTNSLRDWLLTQPSHVFPGGGNRDYAARYKDLENHLFTTVHPEVEKLALSVDGGYLTDHGPGHIRTVIRRASQMIADPEQRLSPYEAYLLLTAIHLHDIGNVFGREGHEGKLADVFAYLGQRLGSDTFETKIVHQIASAHGGKDADGNTIDKIGALPERERFIDHDVRMQFLAAVLRFADEISDDTDRASRLATHLDRLPDEARIYHQYAKQLHAVRVGGDGSRSVELAFTLDADVACTTFQKNGADRYLLDEILSRSLKMHAERVYCSRFMRDFVRLDTIGVRIQVFLDSNHIRPIEEISYSLRELGYPATPPDIQHLVPGFRWDGRRLKRRLEKAKGGGSA